MKFTFTSERLTLFVSHFRNMFPMLSRIIVLGVKEDLYEVFSWNKDLGTTQENLEINKLEGFDSFNIKQKKYTWYNEEELPFNIEENLDTATLDIFREMNRNILVLNITSEDSPLYIFLYFNKNRKHFTLLNKDEAFSHDNREIIAQLATNSIKTLIENRKVDQKVHKYFRQGLEAMALQQQNAQQGQSGEIRLLEKMIVEMANEYLINIGREQNLSIALSPDAREKIASFRGSPSALRDMLFRATILSTNISIGNQEDERYIIENWHLLSVKADEKDDEEASTPILQHRYIKSYQLLDRMEDAVKIVLASQQNVNGVNVGKSMQPPISAPAISDALKKHRNKIISLMQQFPNRWINLKNHFKPLQNILIPKNLQEDRIA